MIREIYRYQNFQKLSEKFKTVGISLPFEASVLIDDAEIVHVPLKVLRREWNGKLYRLEECSPFKYLQTKDKDVYANYIQKHIDLGILPADYDKSTTKFDTLIESMNENGYDPSKCVIILRRDNVLLDGQHRACVLLYKYGGDYTVTAIREKQFR
ncbi:MAG: hypothetical protein J5716_03615 [Alphaproteobacteria bacterium]|nr:hypothetical protein [Alphaproteobacteria bacterium]